MIKYDGFTRLGSREGKGVYYYELKWNTKQPETITSKQKKRNGTLYKSKLTPYTYENLATSYSKRIGRDKIGVNSVGSDIVKMVHAYIEKNNLTLKDKSYDVNKHPSNIRKTRSSS